MESNEKAIGTALIQESIRRLIDESHARILRCLDELSEADLWYRANYQTVGVGNLILHLCGNVRQWICTGLGGQPDHRVRSKEFEELGPIPKAELVALLNQTMADARAVIEALDPARLVEPRSVQGFTETGVSILVHVIEHFSYHTGQITYITKSRKAVDLGYYANQNLNATGQA